MRRNPGLSRFAEAAPPIAARLCALLRRLADCAETLWRAEMLDGCGRCVRVSGGVCGRFRVRWTSPRLAGAFGVPVNMTKCGLCGCGKAALVRVRLYLTWCASRLKCCECDKCAFC